ncbi:hypothetical protein HAX54_009093, partial [Datura stramonium]|nr:hypothetical protein [Datura stramonium]
MNLLCHSPFSSSHPSNFLGRLLISPRPILSAQNPTRLYEFNPNYCCKFVNCSVARSTPVPVAVAAVCLRRRTRPE